MRQFVFLDNTSSVLLKGLNASGSPINDATVTVTLKDREDNLVTGESWPVTLTYVTDSEGDYKGAFSADVDVEKNKEYTAHIVAVAPDGSRFSRKTTVMAVDRDDEGQVLVNG